MTVKVGYVCVVVDLMCCCGASWIEWVGEVDGRALLLLPALLPPLTSGPVLYGGSIIHSQAMRPSELIFAARLLTLASNRPATPPPISRSGLADPLYLSPSLADGDDDGDGDAWVIAGERVLSWPLEARRMYGLTVGVQ